MPKLSCSTRTRLITLIMGLFFSFMLLMACQPNSRFSAQRISENKNEAVIIEDELKKTTPDTEDLYKDGLVFQAPVKKIKNKQTDILLDRTKIENAKVTYDTIKRKFKVSGVVHLFDENKTEIASLDFALAGSHSVEENVFYLKPELKAKSNSLLKPVVRAKVTCLNLNNKDQFDCELSVVDFFIAYKKEIYSEQMELLQKTKSLDPVTLEPPSSPTQPAPAPVPPQPPKPVEPTPTSPATNPTPAPTAPDLTKPDKEDDLQSEGKEESLDGRFEGQVQTADLPTVFADDEAQIAPATKEPKKDKDLTKDLKQTSDGDIRQVNQSVGFPDNGRLRNSTNVFTKQQGLRNKAFFEVVNPGRNRHFSTYEMADMISRLGENIVQIFNKKLYVGNISQNKGGHLPPHVSHQIGLDADLGYPATQDGVKFPVVVQMKSRQYNPSSYSVAKTYELLKFAFKQDDIKVDRIFTDRIIKKALCDYAIKSGEFASKDKELVQNLFQSMDHVDGHGDHFHVRLKCSSYDPGCRQKIYTVNKGCG